MRSSAVFCTLCVGNLLLIPTSIAEAAGYQFTVSPVKRMTSVSTTTYPSSALIFSAQRFYSWISPSSMRQMMLPMVATRSPQSFLWSSIRQCSTGHSKKVSIGNPCIDAVFQYGIHDSFIASQFLNSVLGLKEDSSIQEVVFLPRDLPSSDPLASMGYNFTVDVRCKTKDGRHFLVEMQNDFRDDYHLKALIEHSRMLSRMDLDQSGGEDQNIALSEKTGTRKFWKGIQGIYSVVLTNKVFSRANQKAIYSGESLMEPELVNPYELRHVHQLERHYGDVPNQIILLMLANLPKKLAKVYLL